MPNRLKFYAPTMTHLGRSSRSNHHIHDEQIGSNTPISNGLYSNKRPKDLWAFRDHSHLSDHSKGGTCHSDEHSACQDGMPHHPHDNISTFAAMLARDVIMTSSLPFIALSMVFRRSTMGDYDYVRKILTFLIEACAISSSTLPTRLPLPNS
jgi:hypothetical protein